MGKFSTQTKLICLLILTIGGLLSLQIKRETDYINHFHELILPIIAEKSFFIGCVSELKNNIELCRVNKEVYKNEIRKISNLKDYK